MRKKNGFGLIEIIIIMIITAIIASITTGVIMLNRNTEYSNNLTNLNEDEYLQEFIEVYETIVTKYYDEVDRKGMLEAAETGMLDFLGDKYTTYLEDTEYNSIINELSDTYYGIGIRILNNEIVDITKDSPAEKVGLQVNDLIIKIDGTIVTNLSADDITKLIKDDKKEMVSLTINRNGEEIKYEIRKEELINQTVEYEIINDKIGYLSILTFSEKVDEQVKKALDEMEALGMESLIIDVRDNVGGYLSSGEKTAALFLEKGKIIYSLESNNSTYTYKDETADKKTYQIAVLINGSTASSAEILTAALKESYGAITIGTKSYGKGMVQQVLSLNSGDSVKVSTAKWLTPKGVCIDGVGIKPDYVVEYSPNIEYDSQIQKAIELLS